MAGLLGTNLMILQQIFLFWLSETASFRISELVPYFIYIRSIQIIPNSNFVVFFETAAVILCRPRTTKTVCKTPRAMLAVLSARSDLYIRNLGNRV